MAKATPARGVLKAADTPAAPPAMTMAEETRVAVRRWNAAMMAALTWTVGPSRPTEAPQSRAATVRTIFHAAVDREMRFRARVSRTDLANAMTWGMPDPRAAGASRRVR